MVDRIQVNFLFSGGGRGGVVGWVGWVGGWEEGKQRRIGEWRGCPLSKRGGNAWVDVITCMLQ